MERIREYSYCCGAGAGCKSAYPDFALFAASERVEEAKSTGASALVSTCPFCKTNLQDALSAKDDPMDFYDLTQLVLKSLEGDE